MENVLILLLSYTWAES